MSAYAKLTIAATLTYTDVHVPPACIRWAVVDSRNNFNKYGDALSYIQNVTVKSQLITTRKA